MGALARRARPRSSPDPARHGDCNPSAVALVALKHVAAVGTVALLLTVEAPGQAQAPALPGWQPLGEVRLDRNGCAGCPAVIAMNQPHRRFGLASDSPSPVTLSGRIDVSCANGTTYNTLLQSPRRGGLFQIVPNACVNLEAKEIKLTITSVVLSPQDQDRTVGLYVYAAFG